MGGHRAGRVALPAAVRLPRGAGHHPSGVAGRGRRLRVGRRRLRHRPHRPRLRRGGPAGGPGRGPARPQPGRRRCHLRPPRPPLAGPLREGRRPRDHRRPRRAGAAGGRAGLRAQLPALLALRHAAHLLGQDVVVRAHGRPPGRPAGPERAHRLAPRAHQARPLRTLAGGQRRLGAVARPLLGHAAAHLALRGLRPPDLRGLGGRAVGAGGARPVGARPAPRRAARARSAG